MNMKTYIELIDTYKKYKKIIELINTANVRKEYLEIRNHFSGCREHIDEDCVNKIMEYYENKMLEIENKLGVTKKGWGN